MKSKQDRNRFTAVGISLIIITLTCIIVGGGYFYFRNYNQKDLNKITDAEKFKKEYESLNGVTLENSTLKHMTISIPDKNVIKYSKVEEILSLLRTGTGVIYFGFPECPWCRSVVPVLLKSAEEVGLEQLYYFNAKEIRDEKHLDENGNIIIDKEGSKEYQELLELLKDVLSPYEGLNDPNTKRLYFPTVVFVKNGHILDIQEGSIHSQTDPYRTLTEEEQAQLQKIYEEKMQKTIVCDELC